jgi:hypothetical protein
MSDTPVYGNLVLVSMPAGPLEPSIAEPLTYGAWTFDGFFDRAGKYYERITRQESGFTLEVWVTLAESSEVAA